MVAATGLDPRAAEPGDARAREVRRLRLGAGAESEDVEPLVTRAQSVELAHPVDDAVPLPDVERSVREQADAGSSEDEEDLLLRGLPVERCRPLARIDLDPLQPDRLRAGRPAEVGPLAGDVAGFSAVAPSFVPMGDHMPIMSRASAVRKRPTTSSVPFFAPSSSRGVASASRSKARSSTRSCASGRTAPPV
jgi:hypothetical protein